jgi:hypothetical protein
MMTTSTLAVCALAALAVGCGSKKDDGGGKARPAPPAAQGAAPAVAIDGAPAPPAPVVIDAAPLAAHFALPADARLVPEPEAKQADARALGAEVRASLVDKVAAATGDDTRRVDQLLVLEGQGAVVVELGFASDAGGTYPDEREALRPVSPLAPPRPFAKGDAAAPLTFKGPLAYVKRWAADDQTADDLAIGQDGDAVVVWRSQTLDGEAGDWFVQARIALAPGARVTWK